MSKQELFLKLLFGEHPYTCFARDAKGTGVYSAPRREDEFFCVNQLDHEYDRCPSEPYHHQERPRRADNNVVCFRNFILELDEMGIEEQIVYVKSLVPVSAITYSGGKSVHFIISLETPLTNIDDYRDLAERLHKLVSKSDPACKNPSRLSRLPEVVRKDTGRIQSLLELNKRVPNEVLYSLLPASAPPIIDQSKTGVLMFHTDFFRFISAPDDAIRTLGLSGRNAFFYWLGCRMKEVGANHADKTAFVNRAYSNLQNTSGFTIREAMTAARV